jgi:hypothetical protein
MSDEVATPVWPSERSAVHALQRVTAVPEGWVEVVGPGGKRPLDQLVEAAASGYRAAFPDSELVEFGDRGSWYLFDLTDDPTLGRQPRVVAAWGHSSSPHSQRDKSRQAGFPLPPGLAGRGYERGHLLAHATGGGLDENLFAQAGHVNQGRSPAGRAYRRLERLAGAHPGSLLFHRLVYGDGTDVPDLTQLTVAVPTATHTGTFDNRPEAWHATTTERLVRGQMFHRDVQTAFLAGLVAAGAHPEHTLALHTGRRRVDLLIVPEIAGVVTAVVVEIKNSDWDTFSDDRVRPNLRRHLRQLQDYLDHYIDNLRQAADLTSDIDEGDDSQPLRWDAVIGVLLYPRRPSDSDRVRLIEDVALEQALTVVWYDETEWHSGGRRFPMPSADSWLSRCNA